MEEIKSKLQEQADQCRLAQKNLDDARVEYDKQYAILQSIEKEMVVLNQKFADQNAKFNELAIIKDFAQRAVSHNVNEMQRICRQADPYKDNCYGEKVALGVSAKVNYDR